MKNNLNFDFKKLMLAIAVLIATLLFLPSCNSNAGGSTGGNPLESSLPLQISADVQ